MHRFFLALTLSLTLSLTLRADPPVASYLYPAGGQRGTTVHAHVGGLHLNERCGLELLGTGVTAPNRIARTATPWYEGPVLTLREAQRQEDYPRAMAGTFTIAPDAAPGSRFVLLQTSQGSTGPLKFIVGNFPEVVEDETANRPTPVTLPVTANGRIFPYGSTDEWEATLKVGQVLTCIADAESFGSPLQPRLEVLASDGRLLAESDSGLSPDPVLHFKAPTDGTYRIRIRDGGLKGGPAYVYRLTLTTGPWVDSVFPLGGRRGQEVMLSLAGANVASDAVRISIPKDAGHELGLFPMPGSNPVWLDVDDLPEVNEGESLPVPGVGNGRIAKPGEADACTVAAKKGQRLSFELRAAQLGSPLMGTLALLDSTGKELARAEPGLTPTSADPVLDFTAPADGDYRIEVRDRFRSRGGDRFAYRLRVREQPASFTLTLPTATLSIPRGGKASVKVAVTRSTGFTAPIDIQFEGLPKGVTGPEKLTVKPNQAVVDVSLSAAADAAIATGIVRILGTSAGSSVRVEATFPTGLGEPKLEGLRASVAMPTPFRIYGEYASVQQPRGSRYAKRYLIERTGYDGPIEITLAEKQARHLQGVTGPTITVPAGATDFTYEIDLPPWMDIGRTCRVCVLGTARVKDVDGSEHVVTYSSITPNDQMIAVVEPGRLAVQLEPPTLPITPNSETTLPITLLRAKGLEGAATITAILPPGDHGVAIEPITIPADQGHGELRIRFDRTASRIVRIAIRAVIATAAGPVTAEESLTLVPVEQTSR